MYSLGQLRRGVKHPALLFRELNRQYHTRLGLRPFNPAGVHVFDEDWDNLLILDACRYDMFADNNILPGTLEKRQSRGSSTIEFLRANVDGTDLRDTVYVTANPQLAWNHEQLDSQFHAVINVWQDDGWAEDMKTVLPETVNQYAIEAATEYPDKRIVVHYMQPHAPFLTDTDFDKESASVSFWYDIIHGDLTISRETVWDAYVETLKMTLPSVKDLMTTLTGKTVVTADHGNMVGDRSHPIPHRDWGHPHGLFTPQLVTVPWLTYINGERRKILKEDTETAAETDEQQIRSRLADLGYDA